MPRISSYYSFILWCLALPCFFFALFLFYTNTTVMLEWHLFNPLSTPIKFLLLCDTTGCLFASTVLFISANVLYFTTAYMSHEQFLPRFTHLVILFVLSMNLLIFIPHMMALLLGWDGLGLISFALVIYYQNPKSLGAGMITVLTNRIGDVMILIAIAWILNQGHWSISYMWDTPFNTFICGFILIAAMTKSAQMPFSSWLPAAMAAPTPVSALVHSSTLVTAGVFLLIRFFPFMSQHPMFSQLLLFSSTMTMFMAGVAATAECDLKKIIALSTLSQLGVMMMSLSLHLPQLAFFHLLTHALFKALLFLTAGTIIYLHLHTQDLRSVANLTFQLPLTMSCMLVANLALSGMPFLAGFYSKDLILESLSATPFNLFIMMMAMMATALTSFYSTRFTLTAAWGPWNISPLHSTHDSTTFLTTPMMWLTTAAISAGSALNWLIIPYTSHPILMTPMKLLPLILMILGLYLAWFWTTLQSPISSFWASFSMIHFFMSSMWFLTPLSTQSTLQSPMTLAKTMTKTLDQGWWELAAPQGTHFSLSKTATSMQPASALAPPSFIIPGVLLTMFMLLFISMIFW